MILESLAVIGLGGYALYQNNKDEINKRRYISDVQHKWKVLMDSIGNKSENKIKQEYELLKIIPTHYGFSGIVSLPYGIKYTSFIDIIPYIEHSYKANACAKMSPDKNSVYIKVHELDKDISDKEDLKFKWFKTFYNLKDCINKNGETLQIDYMEDIKSPSDEVVGYKISSKIPLGIKYNSIKESYDVVTRTLGKCFLNFNNKELTCEFAIINKPISDNTKFEPIKVKPYQLYVAMGYDYSPIILDYSKNANALIGGTQGSGKTVSEIMAFINLCNQCNDFKLFLAMKGDKTDLHIFKDTKQCMYYADDDNKTIALLKYLKKEMNRRNKIFSSQNKFIFNIHQYNKLPSNKDKLEVWHLLIDEIADFNDNEVVQELLWDLIRKSRSSGIYITLASQRASLQNMSSEIKGQLANKICFSQPNTASALTICNGEDVAKRVMSLEKSRECLVDYLEGVKIAKTLFLSTDMMEELLEPCIEENHTHIELNNNGDVIEPVASDNTKSKPKKEPRFKNLMERKNNNGDKVHATS